MAEIEFYPNPTEQEYAGAIAAQTAAFNEKGGIWVAMMKYERSVRPGGALYHIMGASALVARHVEPEVDEGAPYDPYLGITHSFKRGMLTGFGTVELVHADTVTTGEILRTMVVTGVSAVEGSNEYASKFLSQETLQEIGRRGLRLIGSESREIVETLANEVTVDYEKREAFKLGYGTVMHIADALHIQYNMQQHDLFVSSDDWTSELEDISRLNTGE